MFRDNAHPIFPLPPLNTGDICKRPLLVIPIGKSKPPLVSGSVSASTFAEKRHICTRKCQWRGGGGPPRTSREMSTLENPYLGYLPFRKLHDLFRELDDNLIAVAGKHQQDPHLPLKVEQSELYAIAHSAIVAIHKARGTAFIYTVLLIKEKGIIYPYCIAYLKVHPVLYSIFKGTPRDVQHI